MHRGLPSFDGLDFQHEDRGEESASISHGNFLMFGRKLKSVVLDGTLLTTGIEFCFCLFCSCILIFINIFVSFCMIFFRCDGTNFIARAL